MSVHAFLDWTLCCPCGSTDTLTMHRNINVWKYWFGATEPKPCLSVLCGNANEELRAEEKIVIFCT